jgi:hypothetical protein
VLRIFVLTVCLGLACGAAQAADDLIQRDLAAFLAFSQVRGQAVEEAIQRRDREQAKALATRLHQEECRFLERVSRHLRDQKSPVAAELQAFLESYRELPLTETVRMRRLATQGSRVHELALAALGAPPGGLGTGAGGAPKASATVAQTTGVAPLRPRTFFQPKVLADVAEDFDRRPRRSGSRSAFPSAPAAISIPDATGGVAIEDTALASGIRVPKK